MLEKYLSIFLISMVPIVELRGAVPIAMGMGIPTGTAILVCVLGNMLPVPFIYLFARKFLLWGCRQRFIGKFCGFFVMKGESAGRKLTETAGKRGMFLALVLFVGIPLPGTGAWTGTLAASFLDLGSRMTALAVGLGVMLAGIIMAAVSGLGLHLFGL